MEQYAKELHKAWDRADDAVTSLNRAWDQLDPCPDRDRIEAALKSTTAAKDAIGAILVA